MRKGSVLFGVRQTTLFQRGGARAIDALILLVIYLIGASFYLWVGVIASAIFAALHDSFGEGQSVGKRIMGIRVVNDVDGGSCSYRESILRNLPFIFGVIFLGVPGLWIFFLVLCVPYLLFESYLIILLSSGVRLGDILANTLVVEYLGENIEAFRS